MHAWTLKRAHCLSIAPTACIFSTCVHIHTDILHYLVNNIFVLFYLIIYFTAKFEGKVKFLHVDCLDTVNTRSWLTKNLSNSSVKAQNSTWIHFIFWKKKLFWLQLVHFSVRLQLLIKNKLWLFAGKRLFCTYKILKIKIFGMN